jgi:hypothetical protein
LNNSQSKTPGDYHGRASHVALESTYPPAMRSSRIPVSRRSGPPTPPIRTVHLTGYFCRPGDPEYAAAAKASDTKGKQDVYWFQESASDMMWDELDEYALYSPEILDSLGLYFGQNTQLSLQETSRSLKQEKATRKKDARVETSNKEIADKKGKEKSTREEKTSAEALSKVEAEWDDVFNASPRKLKVDEIDDISVAMRQEAQQLAHALNSSDSGTITEPAEIPKPRGSSQLGAADSFFKACR